MLSGNGICRLNAEGRSESTPARPRVVVGSFRDCFTRFAAAYLTSSSWLGYTEGHRLMMVNERLEEQAPAEEQLVDLLRSLDREELSSPQGERLKQTVRLAIPEMSPATLHAIVQHLDLELAEWAWLRTAVFQQLQRQLLIESPTGTIH